MNTCIEVKNLTKSFNGRTVVDKISFRVEKGEVFGLLGHNGAGKSIIESSPYENLEEAYLWYMGEEVTR